MILLKAFLCKLQSLTDGFDSQLRTVNADQANFPSTNRLIDLVLMFLADTIEYGQWKLGRRHESVTFSIQPLINKIGGALSTGVISVSVILAGIKTRDSDVAAEAISASGVTTIKIAMLLIPVICIVAGFVIYLKKYKIDEEFYAGMISDLKDRGEIEE